MRDIKALPMRITQIMLSKGWGGAERLFVELCQALSGSGNRIQCVIRPSFVKRDLLENIEEIEVVYIPARGNWDLLSAWSLKTAVTKFRPHLIHTHLSRATWMGGLIGKWTDIATLATTHNPIKSKYCRNIDWFSTITEDLKDHLIKMGFDRKRIRVIPNFSRLEPVENLPPITRNPPTFISFGRFVRKKGYLDLINAFKIYVDHNADGNLVIGGGGPEKPDMTDLIHNLELQNQVRLTGWIDDVEEFLDSGDIFVLPSRQEPFGIVVLEAMARGKPVVTTRTSGPSEVLDDSTAYFAEIQNPTSLYEAMQRASDDHEGRDSKASKALVQYISHYTLDAVLPRFIEYYRTISHI